MAILTSELEVLDFSLGDALLSDYVKKHAEDMPEKVAINYYGREVTYKELDESSDRLAAAIADMGYKKGERLGIFLQPCPQCFIAYLSSMKLGMISVPIDPMSKELELEYFLKDSGARLVITMDHMYPVVESVKEKTNVKDIIVTSFHDYLAEKPSLPIHQMMKPPKQTFPGAHELVGLIERYQSNPPKVDVKLSDYGYILYTGGTTGWPKGCVHTQSDLIYCALGQKEMNLNKATGGDTLFSSWPLTHISGITLSMAPTLLAGMTVIQLMRWESVAAMEAISRYGVTLIAMAIPSYYDIINHPDVNNYNLSSLRVSHAVPFAMPITNEIVEKWEKLTGCPLYDWGYGSSEHMNYCGYGHGLPFPRPMCSTFSRPLPEVQIKILDFETGEELAEGEEGEIVTKEPAQLKEYWNKPRETEEDIVDGWVHMHDRGYIKGGILYFIGKASDVVKVSGYTVALKEVETFGMEHPDIERIAVIGVPHPRKGNELKAFVVLKPESQATASDIEEWFKEKLASFKRPRVEIRTDLPTSGKGETLKRALTKEEEEKRKGAREQH
jgi:long-chain acyl-CoA synthetase